MKTKQSKKDSSRSPIVINFSGEPSSGKSTAAGALFAYMKQNGYKVEIVPEFAKTLAYTSSKLLLQDQLFVFANQNNLLSILANSEEADFHNAKLDYIIVDSPLYLSILYGRIHQQNAQQKELPIQLPDSFFQLVMDYYNQYDNRNILMQREHAYASHEGRVHSEQESNTIRSNLIDFLNEHHIGYSLFKTHNLSDNQFNLGKTLFDFCVEKNIIQV